MPFMRCSIIVLRSSGVLAPIMSRCIRHIAFMSISLCSFAGPGPPQRAPGGCEQAAAGWCCLCRAAESAAQPVSAALAHIVVNMTMDENREFMLGSSENNEHRSAGRYRSNKRTTGAIHPRCGFVLNSLHASRLLDLDLVPADGVSASDIEASPEVRPKTPLGAQQPEPSVLVLLARRALRAEL